MRAHGRSVVGRWLRWLGGTAGGQRHPRRRARPEVTQLEERDCPAIYNFDGTQTIFFPTVKPGTKLSFEASISTTDPNDSGTSEDENLIIHFNSAAHADITIPTVYGQTPVPQQITFTPTQSNPSITASIGGEGADGDEQATIITPGTVIPTGIQPNNDGTSYKVTYQVVTALAPGQQVPIALYWATGTTGDDALSAQQPDEPADSLDEALTYKYVPAQQKAGTYSLTFTKADVAKITTASGNVKDLLAVADPDDNLGSDGDPTAVFADPVHADQLTGAQIQKMMPGLSLALANGYSDALQTAMTKYGITSLEQRAMFLAQMAGGESQNLTQWSERPQPFSADPDTYFTLHYWVCPSNGTGSQNTVFNSNGVAIPYGTKWRGLNGSVPTTDGLTLNVAAGTSTKATKVFDLAWADGASPGVFESDTFMKVGSNYTFDWGGTAAPALATTLRVIDHATGKTVLTIRNTLGEFQPSDAPDFRGSGPIMTTGRYNFQLLATGANLPEIMTNPGLLRDNANNPQYGFTAAAFYFSNSGCVQATTDDAGQTSTAFNHDITGRINTAYLNEANRLTAYNRIRAWLLNPNL